MENPTPHPIDIFVGQAIRVRRKILQMSQHKLSEKIGLTFQQVQKYERGLNRVSCSKLVEIANALDVPPAFFFEGLKDVAERPTDDGYTDLLALAGERGGLELARLYLEMGPHQRSNVLNIARAIIEANGPAPQVEDSLAA